MQSVKIFSVLAFTIKGNSRVEVQHNSEIAYTHSLK